MARLVDATALATLVPRGVVFEDEHGSAAAALAGLAERVVAGEGQPHRKQGMPRWRRERWVEAYGADIAMGLHGSPTSNDVFVVLADGTAMRNGAAAAELGGGIVAVARGYDHTLVLKGE